MSSKNDIAALLELAKNKTTPKTEESPLAGSQKFRKHSASRTNEDRRNQRLELIYQFINENGMAPGPHKVPVELIWRRFIKWKPSYKKYNITKQYFCKRFSKIFELKRREKFRCYLLDNTLAGFDLSPLTLRQLHGGSTKKEKQ